MCRLMGMAKETPGDILRRHREMEPKITLDKLAKETRVFSPSRIGNYEQNSRAFGVEEAKIIADAFTRLGRPITTAQLLGIETGNNPSKPKGPSVNVDNLADCIALLEETLPSHIYRIKPKRRAQIVQQMYGMVTSDGKIPMAEIIRLVKPIKDRFGGGNNGGKSTVRP